MLAQASNYRLRKSISPFICSTPLDFRKEREYLAKHVFPAINNFCRGRGTNFTPIDIRWSPDDSTMTEGHFLRLSLDLIAQTAPFFLCLLGETYGPYRPKGTPPISTTAPWMSVAADSPLDKNYLYAASAGYKWVLSEVHQNCSLTELEVFQAAFLTDSEYCYFYYRQPEHLEDKIASFSDVADSPADLEIYKPESTMHGLKIEDLKQRVVLKGHPVKYFRTVEELGDMVLTDWITVIDQIYPPMINQESFLCTEAFREWMFQEDFAESRREIYINTSNANDVMQQLTDFAHSAKTNPLGESQSWRNIDECLVNKLRNRQAKPVRYESILAVCGDRGEGKSTLIAHWQSKVKDLIPDVKIIFHYIGCSIRSRDLGIFLRNVACELREYFLLGKQPLADNTTFKVDSVDFADVVESFLAATALGPCVLVLDGIDELHASYGMSLQEIKELKWLPFPLPPQCRIIVTTSRSDVSFLPLAQRKDVRVLRLRHLLDDEHVPSYLEEYLGRHFPLLTAEHIEILQMHKLAQHPLFLNLVVSELKCISVYRNLDVWLNSIYEVTSVREVMVMALQRWVTDYSWISDNNTSTETDDALLFDFRGWVPDVFRLLIASRGGLTLHELIKCLEQLGYRNDLHVTMYHWWNFQLSISQILCIKPGGLLDISHHHYREILSYILFRQIKPVLLQIQSLKSETLLEENRKLYHSCLYHLFMHHHSGQHSFEELPWQAMLSGNVQGLTRLLVDLKFLMEHLDEHGDNPSNRLDMMHYWSELIQLDFHVPNQLEKEMIKAELLQPDLSSGAARKSHDMEGEGGESGEYESDPHKARKNPPVQIPVVQSLVPNIPTIMATVPSDRNISVINEIDEDVDASHISLFEVEDMDLSNPSNEPESEQLQGEKETPPVIEVKKKCHKAVIPGHRENKRLPHCQIGALLWVISEYLWDLRHSQFSIRVLLALIAHLKSSAPLSLTDCEIQAKAHRRFGNICQQQGDLMMANKYYRMALSNLVAIEHSFDETPKTESVIRKGKVEVLNEIVENLLLQGTFEDTEALTLEALMMIKNCPGCHTLQASLLYNQAIIHFHYKHEAEAEACLMQCLALREQWFGQMHVLVADTLVALGQLLSQPSRKSSDKVRAETFYRKALHIRSKVLGPNSLQVANLLIDLGRLISIETRLMIRREAARIFKKAMDIKTSHLGPNHHEVKAVQDLLTDMEVSIKLGQYNFGPGKVLDCRKTSLPYSLLTFRAADLEQMESRMRAQSARRSSDKTSGSSIASSSPRPSSAVGHLDFLPASERVLLEPLVRTSLLKQKALQMRLMSSPIPSQQPSSRAPSDKQSEGGSSHAGQPDTKMDAPERSIYLTELQSQDGSQVDELLRDEQQIDSFGAYLSSPGKSPGGRPGSAPPSESPDNALAPYSMPGSPLSTSSRGLVPAFSKVMDKVHPIRTFDLFQSMVPHPTTPRPMVQSASPRRKPQKHLMQGILIKRTKLSPPSTRSTATNTCPHGYCDVPGPFDVNISNYRSIKGPHSDIQSLLGNPPCPREPTGLIHHRSCWYHVPGRYPTPHCEFPPKRNQKSPGVLALEHAARSFQQGLFPGIFEAAVAEKGQITPRKNADDPAQNFSSTKDEPHGHNPHVTNVKFKEVPLVR